MKRTKRKLSLHAQTLRNLSPVQLERVVGAYSSAAATMCSTWRETGCCGDTADDFCASTGCATYATCSYQSDMC
jgi:hypothetical protein